MLLYLVLFYVVIVFWGAIVRNKKYLFLGEILARRNSLSYVDLTINLGWSYDIS